MTRRSLLSPGVVSAGLILLLTPAFALAQGTVIIDRPVPHPRWPGRVTTTPLELKYQRVYGEIVDGVATVEVKQTFRNPTRVPIEGTYVFPLPDEVAVGDFSMTAAGKTLKGEVLEKDKARRIYEDIVRRTRDPGLLEFLGSRLYQASVFPIPAGGQLDVVLKYSLPLREQSGLGVFQHPLRAQGTTAGVIDELVVHVKLKSRLPLTSVFCPSHKCDISRPSDREATVTYEQTRATPDRDFALYYQRAEAQFGLSLLTHRAAGEAGYFLVRIAPRIELPAEQAQPKDLAFVIDTSGSMQGEKIEQVRRALKFCVNSLNPGDRFNIYAFSTDVRPFRDGLVKADADVKQAAAEFADRLQALGGTNINAALLRALQDDPRDDARPYVIVFMTDGLPTVGEGNPDRILQNVAEKNSRRVRFHVLGVGHDVNTHLLDKLAETNRGTRDYASPGEDLELKLSGLALRLAHPVLTDIRLTIEGLSTSDVYPREVPDLFRGNDIVVLGRYEGEGRRTVAIDARVQGGEKKLTFEGEFAARESGNDFLPRLWANRKVAYLLDQIRLHGRNQELVDEVIRLATRYGIVTPYTSALILEDERSIALRLPEFRFAPQIDLSQLSLGARAALRERAGRAIVGGQGDDALAVAGEAALDASQNLFGDQQSDAIAEMPGAPWFRGEDVSQLVRQQCGKTLLLQGARYVDSTWDGQQAPQQVVAFSDEYFSLLRNQPQLAPYLAVAEQVLVVWDGVAYEITPATAEKQAP